MINLTINNLSHFMGSNKKSCSAFIKSNPEWKMKEVIKKTGINYIYESNKKEDVLELSYRSSSKTLKSFDKKKNRFYNSCYTNGDKQTSFCFMYSSRQIKAS